MGDKGKYIVVKGAAGLGNRLMSLTTAILYALATGRRLVVDWGDRENVGNSAAFLRNFTCPLIPDDTVDLSGMSVYPEAWSGNLEKEYGDMGEVEDWRELSIDPAIGHYDADILVYSSYSQLTHLIRPVLKAYLPKYSAMDNMEAVSAVLRRYVRPVKGVEEDVGAFSGECFTGRTIGVHVRHTDMKIDPALFFSRLERRFTVGNLSLFLATDDKNMIGAFRDRYDNVITTDKWFPDNGGRLHLTDICPDPTAAEREAIREMFLLAACDGIVFSARSSFGLVASLYSSAAKNMKINVDKAEEGWLEKIARKAGRFLGA